MVEKSVSIVIPAYNEERRIEGTIGNLLNGVSNLKEIIVVFDGTDKTPEIVKATCPDCIILQFEHRLGKGRAIKEGIGKATGDIVAYLDADGSIPSHEVQRLIGLLEEGNFVVSSRWRKDSKIRVKQPFHRIFFGRIFHYFVFFLFRIDLKDTQCGLKIFGGKNIKEVIQKVNVFDWAFDVSVIYHSMKYGLTPTEVGIEWNNEDGSKLKVFKTIPSMFISVIGMWFINKHSNLSKIKTIIKKLESEFLHDN
ncbi:MAG: glycosyltransferase [Cuniculiplasma sp.]